ncbi:unnamed protein product [Auanema sp. JU1783]|nr:unnamed protein product [Auanema sp. JU1783]
MSSTYGAKGLSLRGNAQKLVRQNAKSNLHSENALKTTVTATVSTQRSAAIITKSTQPTTFTVYRDSPSPVCEQENNIIYQIEKKIREEKSKEVCNNSPKEKRKPLTVLKENTYELEEEIFTACNSGATSTRQELSNFNLNDDDKATQSSYESVPDFEGERSEYESALSQKDSEDLIFSAPEFSHDIYLYMRDREIKVRAKPNFISKQPEISQEMRYILIDWLSEVATEYSLHQETLHLASSLVDRTLSRFKVEKQRLQLVGATAMMIAAKYEEIYPPQLKDFVYLTEDCFTGRQFLMMERAILNELKFDVCAPTAQWFGARFASIQNADKTTTHAMQYLLDLSLLDATFVSFRPSYIAAASLCYANILTGRIPWSSKLEEATGIMAVNLDNILNLLHGMFTEVPNRKHRSVYHRYCEADKSEVATLEPPATLTI